MNARTTLLLCATLACPLPLAAQAPAPPPGLLSVARGSDGTEVFIDYASVTRSGAVPIRTNLATEYSVRCGNDPDGADEQRATVRRTRERLICAY